jgi:hypothetical protein
MCVYYVKCVIGNVMFQCFSYQNDFVCVLLLSLYVYNYEHGIKSYLILSLISVEKKRISSIMS